MSPKKNLTVVEAKASSSDAPVLGKKGPVALRVKSAHPATNLMVREAIKTLDSRNGVSLQAIHNFIKLNYPSTDSVRRNYFVRRAIKKGLETGELVRPANAVVTVGAKGRFRLAPKAKEVKGKKENEDPNVQETPKEENKKTKTANGAAKKSDAANEPKKEEVKVPEKSKDDVPLSSKVAPAKKPKSNKAKDEDEEVVSGKTKAKLKGAKLKEAKEPKNTKEHKLK
ncbi:protein B4-like [Nerophis lumbriciformis]|uniref:protein B4-like n=1 Tax=Nerophis lumbriciformis TaxID=546530 RepID=UPI003BACD51B